MNENQEENIHFKMRLDQEVDEAIIPTQVDELRIEKLSQRITLISILIPVLIVVILGVAYLDIKRRVIRTEDSGAVTAQHLSEDLESRFSSLSLRQAHLEEALAKLQDLTNQSLAKAQVNLQKLDENLKQSRKTMVSQKEMKTATQNMDQGMSNLAHSVEDTKAQVNGLMQTLDTRFAQADQQVAEQRVLQAQFKETLTNLEQNKLDKAAMDLALKLEILKTKQLFNSRWDDLQAQLQAIQQSVAKLSAAQASRSPSTQLPVPSPPKPAAPSSVPAQLQEQTIGK